MNCFNPKHLFGGLFLLYPFIIYFFLNKLGAAFFIALFAVLIFLRFGIPYFLQKRTFSKQEKMFTGGGLVLGVVFLGLCAVFGKITFYYYPVLASLTMAGVFFGSLLSAQSLIERLARMTEPGLDEKGIAYTRKVTIVWGMFCLFNALVSYGTIVLGREDIWVLYNGIISYVLMGILFGVEYGIRRFMRRTRKK